MIPYRSIFGCPKQTEMESESNFLRLQGSESERFHINTPQSSFFFLCRLRLSQKSRRQSRAAAATTGQTCNRSAFAQRHAEPTAKTLLRINTHFLISSRCAPSESNVVAECRDCVSVPAVGSRQSARALSPTDRTNRSQNQPITQLLREWAELVRDCLE